MAAKLDLVYLICQKSLTCLKGRLFIAFIDLTWCEYAYMMLQKY